MLHHRKPFGFYLFWLCTHLPPSLDGVERMTKFGSNPLYISQDSSVFLDHGLVQAVGMGFTARHTGVTVSHGGVESVGDGSDGERRRRVGP